MANVRTLLSQSWAAHAQYRAAVRREAKADAKAALQKAYELRIEAHTLDPDHADQAWEDEGPKTVPEVETHKAMMDFYRRRLDI